VTAPDDPSEQLRRVNERAKAARARASIRYDWRKQPVAWTAWYSAALFRKAPDEFKNDITIAAAVVRDQKGDRRPVVAANHNGYMDPRCERRQRPPETPSSSSRTVWR
jgi:hypothetical protein